MTTPFVQRFDGQGSLRVGDFLAIHQNTTLLDQLAGLTVRAAQASGDHGSQQTDGAVL